MSEHILTKRWPLAELRTLVETGCDVTSRKRAWRTGAIFDFILQEL
jgi:hypothetical protein